MKLVPEQLDAEIMLHKNLVIISLNCFCFLLLNTTTCVADGPSEFTYIGFHAKPGDAQVEIDALVNVYELAVAKFGSDVSGSG